MEEHRRFDALALRAAELASVDIKQAAGFLFKNGLAVDAGHAVSLIRAVASTDAGCDSASDASGAAERTASSASATSSPDVLPSGAAKIPDGIAEDLARQTAKAILNAHASEEDCDSGCESDSQNCGQNEQAKPSSAPSSEMRFLAAKAPDPVASAHETARGLFPGLFDQERGSPLLYGAEFVIRAAGLWVSARSDYCKPFNGPRSLASKLNLCINARTTRERARLFRIEPLHEGAAGKTVQFGETVRLVSGRTKHRVKLACPGRAGTVHLCDHVFVVGMDAKDEFPTSTWVLSQTQRLGGVVPVVPAPVRRQRELEASPLCLTLLPQEVAREPVSTQQAAIPAEEERRPEQSGERPESTSVDSADAVQADDPALSIRDPEPDAEVEDPSAFASLDLSVIVYNTWMMPRLWGILKVLQRLGVGLSYKKSPRSRMIPGALLASLDDLQLLESAADIPDVIVLCELFCDKAGPRVRAGLKRKMGLLFETPVGGSGPIVETHAISNSGVVVLSRYPIIATAASVYKNDWARDDGLANKSAVFARVLKAGRPVNVFATHLQAWEYKSAVRAREGQMLHMRRFAQRLRLPGSEPVIYAGDLNVCRVRSGDQYDRMLGILGAKDTHHVDPATMRIGRQLISLQEKRKANYYEAFHGNGMTAVEPDQDIKRETLEEDERLYRLFSFNSTSNTLAMGGPSSGDACALLDYALYSVHHREPKYSATTVLSNIRGDAPFRYGGKSHVDLSDHYPVITRFTFEYDVPRGAEL